VWAMEAMEVTLIDRESVSGDACGGFTAAAGWPARYRPAELTPLISAVRQTVHVVRDRGTGQIGLAVGGRLELGAGAGEAEWLGSAPPLYPEWLGDRTFCEVHRVRYPYIAGAMANGIATAELVVALARAGMLGFFGAAGLPFERVERELDAIAAALAGTGATWGANLIHSPNEPELESAVADLFIRRGVPCVSASAYMKLTAAVVRIAFRGVGVDGAGAVVRPRQVFAKVSRPETAVQFMRPPPLALLEAMVARAELTEEEAHLASRLPVSEDITVEADSGGHTDNRPLTAIFPTIVGVRDRVVAECGYVRPLRVGAAGGLGTPSAVAAAFGLGAAYVLTGSVNQAAVESGLSQEAKAMLAAAGVADVGMAPAADMFEMGVDVQVLKRGTLFAQRARSLYTLYSRCGGLEDLTAEEAAQLAGRVFGMPLDAVWEETRAFWRRRNPAELARAEADPHHKMALVFRWYLGKASRWAIEGDAARKLDYQLWCGPAMGAFNAWVAGSYLEPLEQRSVVQIALNLLEGAAHVSRAQQLRTWGVPIPQEAFHFIPRRLR